MTYCSTGNFTSFELLKMHDYTNYTYKNGEVFETYELLNFFNSQP